MFRLRLCTSLLVAAAGVSSFPGLAHAQPQSGDTSAPVVPGPTVANPPPAVSANGQSAPPANPPPQRTPTLQTTQTTDGTTTEAPTEAPKTDRTTVGPSTRATDSLQATDKIDAPRSAAGGRFEFGSYGRVQVASDLRGGTGQPANVVSHGTRIDEDSYAELELRREDDFAHGIHTKVVATLALFAPFFHFNGQETQSLAVRNLYAQAQYGQLTMWVGSRMYRGDDIYLLDWWPLDNQNTYGGGLGWQFDDKNSVAIHAGMTRLDDPTYQYQQIQVVAPFGSAVTNVTTLDRPRIVETAKYTHLIIPRGQTAGVKLIAYGEGHEISAGTTTDTVNNTQQALPSDWGFMVGGEAAFFTGKRDTFLQVFVRHARGLAAYDPLATPTTFGQDKTTQGANETLLAIGGNYEKDWFGLLVGGYVRFFRDASAAETSLQKYDEGTAVLRPQIFIGDHWGVAVEGSFQERRYAETTGDSNSPLVASEWRAGVIPYFSPAGRGSYKRPQFRLLYAVTARNEGARELYAPQDVFAQRAVEHYLGVGVEWWFNSSSYP
jgi:maltoporin